ncbi:MAG: hypothetical protein ACTHMX_04340 [Thermomicrobiales bacterium]
MVDKIVDAINEILGGDSSSNGDQKKDTGSGFVPADSNDTQPQAPSSTKERNLDQLVSDAKKQLGDKPQ